MIFSLHTDEHIRKAVDIFGYAYGYKSIMHYFSNFEYRGKKLEVVQNSPEAQVQMFYMEPEWYNLKTNQSFRSHDFKKFYDHQYKIYGTHLESTVVWPHWINSMDAADEIWVGNNFAAEAVLSSKVKTPVHVFEHGIDDMWKPFKRGQGDKIRFLHVDSGSPRKRADLVEQAFVTLFGDDPNVELTLKYHSAEATNGYSVMRLFKNVNRIFKTISQEEMVQLFYDHDVLVYPSEGEGFGFIPLQALATGMPVISTSRWCSYDKYFSENIIESKLGPTSYTGYLYGDVVLADFNSLMELMKKVYDNISNECEFYYKQAPKVYKEYNWQTRCDSMLKSFIKRVGIGLLEPIENHPDMKYPIKFIGNGKYLSSYINNRAYQFTKDDRIKLVDKQTYDSLISQDIFSDPTVAEVKFLKNNYYL